MVVEVTAPATTLPLAFSHLPFVSLAVALTLVVSDTYLDSPDIIIINDAGFRIIL